MGQGKRTGNGRGGKHLTHRDRIQVEALARHGLRPQEIAVVLGRHCRTIQREIRRGQVEHLDCELRKKTVYSSDRGQDVHDLNATAKGPELKLGKNYEMVAFVSKQIRECKQSPDVVCALMKRMDMKGAVCTKTLYNYIDQGLIEGVSNESLPEKRKRRKRNPRALRRIKPHHVRRTSIEKRPPEVEAREEFGHWEIDLVVGGKDTAKPVLMTLVERKTRCLIVRKLPDKTQESVLKALKGIERSMGVEGFRCTFKSITADNGSEFLDVEALQRSAFSKKQRVKFYYAHPYSSWERGSNENANRMIRRFIKKGRDIASFGSAFVQYVENWINNYPRRILDFSTAQDCFNRELAA